MKRARRICRALFISETASMPPLGTIVLRPNEEIKSAGDLSLKMLSVLALGIALWVVYGFLQSDWVIVSANSVFASWAFGISSCVRCLPSREARAENFRSTAAFRSEAGSPSLVPSDEKKRPPTERNRVLP
jgi:hypothetical protein